jgi:polyphenol oxidase
MWLLKDSFFYDDEFPFFNFVTTRNLGDMKDAPARRKICALTGIAPDSIVYAEQVHGARVSPAGIKDAGKFVKGVDGIATSERNVSLAMFTADCMPVLLGAEGKAAGIVHAGWRGLSKGILSEAVKLFEKEFGIPARGITASIGPHICPGCYTVGQEVKREFGLSAADTNFDLAREAVSQLEKSGIKNVAVCERCTCHEPEIFFSYRKNKTQSRIMSLVAFSERQNARLR